MEQKKVILVDDKKAFRQSFKLLLRKVGGNQVIAEYGSSKEFLEALDKDCNADIIFMDIELPDNSGIETTQKAITRYPGLIIIGISLYDEKIYIDSMIKAGARGYLLKFSDNFSILETIIRHPNAEIFYSKEINPTGNKKHSDKIRILLVDDSDSSLFVSEYTLKCEDFEVIPFSSAQKALKFASSSHAPKLIITDYLMPKTGGMEFVEKIRKFPNYKDVPVLMTSVKVNPEIEKEALEKGINLVLKKPFSQNTFIAAVEKLVFEKKV